MSLGYSYGRRRAGSPVGLWLGLLALGLAAGVGLALVLALPRLVSVAPAAGAQFVSSRAPLLLTFNRPMDTASVEAALTMSPGLPGTYTWEGNRLVFTPAGGWPRNSTITVRLAGGRSQRGLPLVGARAWSFSVGEPRVAYLAGAPLANLWLTGAGEGAEPIQVTGEPHGVYDYAISPEGTRLAYAARRPDGGADLRVLELDGAEPQDLVLCPGEACVSPAFAPDGRRLAYQRHSLVPGVTGLPDLGPAQVFVYELASGTSLPVGQGDTRFPRWGPDGRLAYLDTARSAIVIQDLASGAVTYIPGNSGEMGTWSPDGSALVFAELYLPPLRTPDPAAPGAGEGSGQFYSFLQRVTIATNATANLSGTFEADDASPAFAPSGAWLAFGRKVLLDGQWTLGRQLWVMRPDGSQARALTADPLYNHSAFRWSPDSRTLAYMRFNVLDPGQPAEIWLVDLESETGAETAGASAPRRLAIGYLPEWLP